MNIISLWSDTPRFLRGWFIGNIIYIVALLVTSNSRLGQAIILAPAGAFSFLFSSWAAAVIASHMIWGGLGALLVGLTGEKVGPTLLIILMIVLGFACLIVLVSGIGSM